MPVLRLRTVASAFVGVAVLAGAAGCAADGPPVQPGKSVPDSCALLSEDQIESATGFTFAPGEINAQASRDDISQCVWLTPEGSDLPAVFVHVATTDITTAEQREAATNYYGSTADVEVPGGANAFVTGGGQHVGMEVGPYWVMVTVLEDSEDDLTAPTTELARAVAAALAAH